MQIKAEKRYSNGLTFLANYTLSNAIDAGSNDIGWSGAFGNQDPRDSWFNRAIVGVSTALILSTPLSFGISRR
jgi:hypothetical protein